MLFRRTIDALDVHLVNNNEQAAMQKRAIGLDVAQHPAATRAGKRMEEQHCATHSPRHVPGTWRVYNKKSIPHYPTHTTMFVLIIWCQFH